MLGLMMDRPLLIANILRHGLNWHGDQKIVSKALDGEVRYSFTEFGKRVAQCAHALERMGVRPGDRVGTIALNTHRHVELYYAISCIGAVCHTINPLLGPRQMAFVIKHAEDKVVLFDFPFTPQLDAIYDEIRHVSRFVALCGPKHKPESERFRIHDYESLLAHEAETFDWPEFDENTAAALCYTSGTTGDPKGVLYSHRSTVLHAMAGAMQETMGVTSGDVVLPVVPMFHVNAWGVVYNALMVGSKLVLPGASRDGESLVRMFNDEKVTVSLGVPTVWMNVLDYLKGKNLGLPSMHTTVIGGAAVPEFMIRAFEEDYGVTVRQGWGMTEMSPLGAVNTLKPKQESLSAKEKLSYKLKAGRAVFGVEFRIVDAAGHILAQDGVAEGHLQVRGPWITKGYYGQRVGENLTADGWFDTGDIASLDPDGFVTITDRSKDVIKSGGEWISSVMLENAAMSHPRIARAAVIGVPHPKWQERPILIVVPEPDADPLNEYDVLEYMRSQVDKIAVPDAVVFAKDLPLGATGKVLKTELRRLYGDTALPG